MPIVLCPSIMVSGFIITFVFLTYFVFYLCCILYYHAVTGRT